VVAQVFGSGRTHSSLSVEERLSAVGSGFRSSPFASDELWLVVGVAAGLLLAGALAAWIVARVRRSRWLATQLRSLAAAGLHGEELALFRAVARRAGTIAAPSLHRRSASFDAAAAEMVRRHRPSRERREVLSRLLALRRRVPFEGSGAPPPAFERGQRVLVGFRFGRSEPFRLAGRVTAAQSHALRLALQESDEAEEVAPLLRVGQDVVLVVQRGALFEEARVRIRGVGGGLVPQLLVDRPAALSPSRVRIVWNGADEPVRVALVERFSERLVGDDVPIVAARVVATSSDGLVLRIRSTRPRRGEAIKVVNGARAGQYRGYALLETNGRGGEVFVLRRSVERIVPPQAASEAPIHETVEEEEHEPVAEA